MLFSKEELRRLIVPLMIEQILAVTIGMADTMMVANVGEAAVSGVSLVDSINILLINIFSAMATGGAVVASQYIGRQDRQNACSAAKQLIYSSAFIALLLGLLALVGGEHLLRLVFGSVDADVMAYAETYFWLSALSYPFLAVYNAGAALFRSMSNSSISMKTSILMNIINIGGNALLIYGFGMGVVGAALATLIGRVFAAVWILWQNQNIHNPLRVAGFADLRPRKEPIMKVLAIGVPSGLENGMFQIGKLCVSSLTSTLGTAAIAANAVANSVCTAANVPGATMNLAMIPVVGRCLGAGDKEQAKKYSLQLTGIAIVGLGLTNLAMFLLLPEIITWFHLSAEAASMCTVVVHWFSVFCVVFWAPSFTLPNALRSGGDAKFTMLVSIASMWVFRVILSYFFVLQMHMGLTGVWFGMFVDWICRSILFGVRFYSGKWMEHKVI